MGKQRGRMQFLSPHMVADCGNAFRPASVVPAVHRFTRRDVLTVLAAAASRRPLPGQDGAVFSADVKVVNLLATVRNKQGGIVRGLTREDFTLFEDGRAQTIRYFSRETNLPLTLGLLVDTSGSQRRVLPAETSASHRFLRQVLREDRDQAFVIHFDRESELLADLTSSRQKLEKALDLLEMPAPQRGGAHRGGRGGPGTVLHDAVALASDELMRKQAGRKALIVLSDGVDNGSKLSIGSAIESAQRSDTLVYTILFADPQGYGRPGGYGGHGGRRGGSQRLPNSKDGKKVLERLALETGGGFFEVSKKQPIENVYDRIQEELRNQYSLGYAPELRQPGFHKIRLATRDQALVVQTRSGYYGGG